VQGDAVQPWQRKVRPDGDGDDRPGLRAGLEAGAVSAGNLTRHRAASFAAQRRGRPAQRGQVGSGSSVIAGRPDRGARAGCRHDKGNSRAAEDQQDACRTALGRPPLLRAAGLLASGRLV
jgi:hypothetical protein